MNRLWVGLTLLAAGCGKHPGTYAVGNAAQSGASELLTKADALWAQRADESKLQEAIKAYEASVETDGDSRHALGRLTRAWYFWGDGFSDDKDVQTERWTKAIEYGTRCLAQNENIRAAIADGAKEKEAVSQATKEDVPCLYWTATSLGKWGRAQGLAKTLRHLPTVKAYISKVDELDPSYYHFGPARYWGAYYAALPSFAGQDLDKSAEYFEESQSKAPYYFPTRVLRAEIWAVATEDIKQFDEDLIAVVGGNPNERPEADVTAENLRDQIRARKIFAERAELFPKKVLEAAGDAPTLPEAYEAPTPAAEPMMAAEDEAQGPEGQEPEDESDPTVDGPDPAKAGPPDSPGTPNQ